MKRLACGILLLAMPTAAVNADGMIRTDQKGQFYYYIDNLGDYPDFVFYFHSTYTNPHNETSTSFVPVTAAGLCRIFIGSWAGGGPVPQATPIDGDNHALLAVPKSLADQRGGQPDLAWFTNSPPGVVRLDNPIKRAVPFDLSSPVEKVIAHYQVRIANGRMELRLLSRQAFDKAGQEVWLWPWWHIGLGFAIAAVLAAGGLAWRRRRKSAAISPKGTSPMQDSAPPPA